MFIGGRPDPIKAPKFLEGIFSKEIMIKVEKAFSKFKKIHFRYVKLLGNKTLGFFLLNIFFMFL